MLWVMNMYKILFVCSANVGRSQMAESFYNSFTKSASAKSAAGYEDKREKYSYRAHPKIISVMKEAGLDISKQRVKLLTKELVDEAEKIIVFCNLSKCPEYLQKSLKVLEISVKDPYKIQENKEAFVVARDEIKTVVTGLLADL